jgi:hypothetical protein
LRFWLTLRSRLPLGHGTRWFGLPLGAGLPLGNVRLPRLGAAVVGLTRADGTAPRLLGGRCAGGGGQGQNDNPASNAGHAEASIAATGCKSFATDSRQVRRRS